MLSERLEVRGLTVRSVTNEKEAFVRIKEQNFDIIVIDFAMPGIDGLDTLKLIKKQDPDLEIMLTDIPRYTVA